MDHLQCCLVGRDGRHVSHVDKHLGGHNLKRHRTGDPVSCASDEELDAMDWQSRDLDSSTILRSLDSSYTASSQTCRTKHGKTKVQIKKICGRRGRSKK